MTTDGGNGGAGEGGGAAGEINPLTGEAVGGAAGGGGAGGAGGEGGSGGTGGGAGGGDPPGWWNDLSADAPDDKTLSDRAWAENKKFGAPADIIKSYRQLESQLGGEKLIVPKSAEDKDAWEKVYKVLGRPDAPDGYKFDAVPNADPKLTGAFAPLAHQLGMSQAMVEGVVKFNEQMLADQAKQTAQTHAAEVATMRKDMGDEFNNALERSLRAAERFGLDKAHVDAMRGAIGPKALITMLDTIGKALGEDGMVGGGKRDLGMTAEKAAVRKTEIKNDPALIKKLQSGDPTLKAEWDAIIAVEAAAEERQRAA
jgi:hypothetical protein